MDNAGGINSVKELSIAELEKLVMEYPWFAYARKHLLLKMADNGREHFEMQLKKCTAFIPSLKDICRMAREIEPAVEDSFTVIDFEEINRDIESVKSSDSTKYIVIGGDYFTKEDFDSLEETNSFTVGRFGSADDSQVVEKENYTKVKSGVVPDSFYTETLAGIYAEQGYYEEAMKVYAKLILLYPEKSAYFATLVNKVKSKNN